MTYEPVDLVEVTAWGRTVGAVALDTRTNHYAFQYDPSWLRDGVDLAPLTIPFDGRPRVSTHLAEATFARLPALLADSLPDRFGNALIDAHLAQSGVTRNAITPLDRLAYLGSRAMGALEFRPPTGPTRDGTRFDVATLVTEARRAVDGSFGTPDDATAGIQHLLAVGTSAGGARAKAVIAWNRSSGDIRSGQADSPDGFEQWLIKFDGVGHDAELGTSGSYGRIEYAYHLMARAAGIDMTDCHLLEEGGRAHFMTRRFDRPDGAPKAHIQTLCAMAELDFNLTGVHDYAQFIDTIDRLELGPDARREAFRRAVFNIAAANCDDHTKNQAFVLDESGRWHLTPAYDITHAYNPAGRWTNQHLMGLGGVFLGADRVHLLTFADRYQVPGTAGVIDDVNSAVDSWREHASAAGLSAADTDPVAADFRRL